MTQVTTTPTYAKTAIWLTLAVLSQALIFYALNTWVKPALNLPEGLDYLLIVLISFIPVAIAMQTQTKGYGHELTKQPGQTIPSAGLFIMLVVSVIGIKLIEGLGAGAIDKIFGMFNLTVNSGTGSGQESLAVLNLLYVCLVGPIVEELVYRGAIMRALKPWGSRVAVVISAVAFGLMHHDIQQGFAATITGLLLGTIAIKYGLRYSIILHIIGNSWVTLVGALPQGSPVSIGFGLTGMLMTLATIIFGIVLLVKKFKAKGRPSGSASVVERATDEVPRVTCAESSGSLCIPAPLGSLLPVVPLWALIIFDLVLCVIYSVKPLG